ncbi:serine/arginine repetitive matrix protein 1-like [Haliotis rubra]|uniref:serine/arginine repetitive matrix protein 1-like n=1 Tax=Haliotis rubra TaxID=36100 RepID=UPI001EE5A425|nr:serine/arginine repetitive matrix protein 1-like [Haliotis rubra]
MHDASNNVDSDKEEDTTDPDSKKQRLYKAPRFFKVKKRQRQAVISRSPFSTDRQYDIPKGRPLDIKKGNSSTTQFVEFQKSASNWKPPRKFELQPLEKKSTSFWEPRSSGGRARNKGQTQDDEANLSALERKRREFERSLSPDSGLDSEVVTVSESLKESTEDNFRDSTQQNTETDLELPGLGEDQQYDSGKEASTTESPRQSLSPTSPKKQRSAIVKKERSPIQFTRRKTPEVTPEVTPEPEETKSVDDWSPLPPSREKTLTPPPQEQHIPNVGMPDLPQFRQEQKEGKRSKAQKFFVEGPPEMKAPPKKRKSPPKVRRLPKMHYRKKSRPAEAPMSAGALQEVSDPLDFLAKYCIINPNRLPFYEVIFENMVTDQTPRYERPRAAAEPVERQVTEVVKVKGKGKKSSKKSEEEGLSEHELKLARDMLLINHGQSITSNIGQNIPEEYREKIVYTLDSLQQKAAGLEAQLTQLDMQRVSMLAESTRTLLPDVCAHDYVPPDKKKGKKGKKSKKGQGDGAGNAPAPRGTYPRRSDCGETD